MAKTLLRLSSIAFLVALLAPGARGEDGYKLWLRYARVTDAATRDTYQRYAKRIVVPGNSPTHRAIAAELQMGLRGMLGAEVPVETNAAAAEQPGSITVVSGPGPKADELGDDGYTLASGRAITISSRGEAGALYGAFHLLRLMQTGQPIDNLNVRSRPRIKLRLLNHWDNL